MPAPVPLAAVIVPAARIERVAPVPEPAPSPALAAAAPPASAPPAAAASVVGSEQPAVMPVTVPIAPPSVAPRLAEASARPSGAVFAQLAMAPSAGRARARGEEIRANQPELLGERPLVVAASTYRDQPIWTVRTGPFASARQAESFCQQLQGVGQDCWAMVPAQTLPAAVAAPVASSARAANPVAAAPVAAAPIAAAVPVGAYAQLAASDSAAAVANEWDRLRHRLGPLLRDRPEVTVSAEVGGRTVWRLRTGPFQQPREAEAFCAEVRAAGGGCWAAGS